MPLPQYPRIDLQLLEHLDALISERHVSRAAERMGIGQPAMSAILGKLRQITGDPLLVRTAQGMVPTERALGVAAQVREGMHLIRSALEGPSVFDARQAQRQFRVMAPDSLALTLMPRLMTYFESVAPRVSVVFAPGDVRLARELLETDQCDLVIGFVPEPPEGLRAASVLKQKLCCIVRNGHPEIAGRMSLEQYLAWPHVVFGAGPTPVSTIEASVDKALRERKLIRRVGARVSNILLLPAVVAATSMIATLSERTARAFAPVTPIQVLQPPFPLPDPVVSMLWHDRSHHDPSHTWFRQAVRQNAEGA